MDETSGERFHASGSPAATLCFIATSTGISPFIAMITQLLDQDMPPSISLLFGCRLQRDAVLVEKVRVHPAAASRIDLTVCVSREIPAGAIQHGRVTHTLENRVFDPETRFYLWWQPFDGRRLRVPASEKRGKVYV